MGARGLSSVIVRGIWATSLWSGADFTHPTNAPKDRLRPTKADKGRQRLTKADKGTTKVDKGRQRPTKARQRPTRESVHIRSLRNPSQSHSLQPCTPSAVTCLLRPTQWMLLWLQSPLFSAPPSSHSPGSLRKSRLQMAKFCVLSASVKAASPRTQPIGSIAL